ncbi:MAG TPA: DUF3696 domain-containing protein [Leptolyngbyaceae cyanobacterium]
MLREYQLTNFKAFAGPETIPIRPITLIYGPNSSGKSSILQSLLLLKQTLQEAENPETLLLPKGNLVNLGGYREFIHRHDVSKSFSFKVVFGSHKEGTPNLFRNLVPDNLIETPLLGLKVAFNYDRQMANAVLASVELFIGNDSSPVVIYKPEELANKNLAGDRFRSELGLGKRPLSDKILKLEKINNDHELWKAWWKKNEYNFNSHNLVIAEVKDTLQRSELKEYLRKGWPKRLPRELHNLHEIFQEDLNKIDSRHNWQKSALQEQVRQINYLIKLWQHFDKYTLDKAIEDLFKLTTYSTIAYRFFLPIASNEPGKPDFCEEEIVRLSRVYKRLNSTLDLSELTLLAASTFQGFLDTTIYIGPLREYPERLYILSGNSSQQVGKSGKMLSDILFRNPELLKQVNEQLERFGLEYELKVASYTNKETSELSDVFALRLVDKFTGVNVSLLDVGFGISQVLPIIVQSMLSRNTTLLIEQPEIHIHPRLQAELGSLLAECIKPPLNNQFIIETHSEHLMLRLQKLIRKGELKPEDVSVIYVDRAAEGSKCLHLRLDEEGDFIDEWPGGFFEEDFNEIFQ